MTGGTTHLTVAGEAGIKEEAPSKFGGVRIIRILVGRIRRWLW